MKEISAIDGYPKTGKDGKIVVVDPKRRSAMRPEVRIWYKSDGQAMSAGEVMAKTSGKRRRVKQGPDDGDML